MTDNLSTDHESVVKLYPAWREAVQQFLAIGHKPGVILSLDWLYAVFGIARPAADTRHEVARKAELAFLGQFDGFRNCLLIEHQIALDSVRGAGYRIVPAPEQTTWAEKDGKQELKRALKRLGLRLTHVDLAALSSDERRQNADALARFSMLRGMTQQAERMSLPSMENDETECDPSDDRQSA